MASLVALGYALYSCDYILFTGIGLLARESVKDVNMEIYVYFDLPATNDLLIFPD